MKIVRNYSEKPELTNATSIVENKDEKGNITGYTVTWEVNREADVLVSKLSEKTVKDMAIKALDLAMRSRITTNFLMANKPISEAESALDKTDFNVSGRVKVTPEEKFILDALVSAYGKSKEQAHEMLDGFKSAGKVSSAAKKLGYVAPKTGLDLSTL